MYWSDILYFLTLILFVVSLIIIKILTALFNKAVSRSKIEPTLRSVVCGTFKAVLYIIALLIVTDRIIERRSKREELIRILKDDANVQI